MAWKVPKTFFFLTQPPNLIGFVSHVLFEQQFFRLKMKIPFACILALLVAS